MAQQSAQVGVAAESSGGNGVEQFSASKEGQLLFCPGDGGVE